MLVHHTQIYVWSLVVALVGSCTRILCPHTHHLHLVSHPTGCHDVYMMVVTYVSTHHPLPSRR